MATDSTATDPASTPPVPTDTGQAPAVDTAPNTPSAQPAVDGTDTRYRALQAEFTRKAQALAEAERQLAELSAPEEPESDDEQAPPARKGGRKSQREIELEQALAARDWQIAESIFEPAVIEAYRPFETMWTAATTPADYLNALEAYHQARLAGIQPAPPATPSAPVAAAPLVDSNRQAPATELQDKAREAKEKGNLRGWLDAKLAGG